MRSTRTLALAAALTTAVTAVGGCTLLGEQEAQTPTTDAAPAPAPAPAPATDDAAATTGPAGEGAAASTDPGGAAATSAPPPVPSDPGTVVLAAHDSFTLPEELITAFEESSGYELQIQLAGDAGAMANQVVLTAGRPTADVVFGVDTTFATRVVQSEALAAYTPADLPEQAEEHALGDGADAYLTPIDYGDVCVNIDDVWFAEQGIEPPDSLADLTDPTYADLFVTPGASTSSPGMAFLLATIGEFGPSEWQAYWEDLMANGAKVTSGWTDAYTVDFTAGGGDGDRPIVLSYASSPPATIPEGGWEPTTSALLSTCFRQVEYAGVLEGAGNPEGGQAVVDWLLTPEVQAAIPDNMYMYPVADVELPELWAQFAQVAEDPIVVHPQQIEAERETWLREWADLATG